MEFHRIPSLAAALLAATLCAACASEQTEAQRERLSEAPEGSAASIAGETQWDGPASPEGPPASAVYGDETMDPAQRQVPPATQAPTTTTERPARAQ